MVGNIEELIDLTRQTKILLQRIQSEALRDVRSQKIPDVTEITDTICVVKLSTVLADKNRTLDPNFYSIEAQIKVIRNKLQRTRSFAEMCAAVEAMIDSASVTINKEKTVLHPVIVEAIKTSEIGAYILERKKGD